MLLASARLAFPSSEFPSSHDCAYDDGQAGESVEDASAECAELVTPAMGDHRFTGRAFASAQASIASRFQILPLINTTSGSGNPATLLSRSTYWRLTSNMPAISAEPTR